MRAQASSSLPRAASVMQLVNERAKSAKEKAMSMAEENGIMSSWSSMKAKAQSLTSQVSAKRATSTRRNSGAKSPSEQRAKSAGPVARNASSKEEELIKKICDIGVSPIAAKLALSKVPAGISKIHVPAVACNWLLDEKNIDEIEAAENEEIEKSAAAALAQQGGSVEAPGVAPPCGKAAAHRDSVSSDDGCGLGFFMSRKSLGQPSPRSVPVPGRLSRGSFGGRISTGSMDSDADDSRTPLARRVSMGSQTSAASEAEEHLAAMTPRGEEAENAHRPVMTPRSSGTDDENEPFLAAGGDADATTADEVACAEQEENDDDDEEAMAPLPPDSSCWDWPLSRQEKKARLVLTERRMNMMDRKELLGLKVQFRKASLGGASACHPGRLST